MRKPSLTLQERFEVFHAAHPEQATGEFTLMQGNRIYGAMKTPKPMKVIPPLKESHLRHFWMRVQKTDTCWNWTGAKTNGGYGIINVRTVQIYVHRLSYSYHKGEIPLGFVIDHLCHNRLCVNPDHLESVPQAINSFRSDNAVSRNLSKTHCSHGHNITDPGQYILDQGSRRCLICKREKEKRGRERRKLLEKAQVMA